MQKKSQNKLGDDSWRGLLEENRLLRQELDALRAEKFAMRERQINDSATLAGLGNSQRPCFSAVYIQNGQVGRMTFDAADIAEAQALAVRWGVGVEGETCRGEAPALPLAYDMETVRQLLGGVSRSQVYVWLTSGRLERLPGTRRVLITRESLEKFRSAA